MGSSPQKDRYQILKLLKRYPIVSLSSHSTISHLTTGTRDLRHGQALSRRRHDDMPSKTPHTNGNDLVENGVNSAEDVEVKDDVPNPLKGGKGKKAKEGEEEKTVVVPPSKGSKLSGPHKVDNEGDVVMDGFEDANEEDLGAPMLEMKMF